MKHSILLVNTNISLLLLYKAYLSQAGYNVHIARNLLEVETELRTKLFSIVITELRMSEDGWNQGLRVIEQVNVLRAGTPILALTSSTDLALHRRARKLGLWDIVLQPTPMAELEHLIRNILHEVYESHQGSAPPSLTSALECVPAL